MESWSPFMNAQILGDETLNQIGKEVNKSAKTSRHSLNMQHGVIVIPKSVTPQRIEENINVFDLISTNR